MPRVSFLIWIFSRCRSFQSLHAPLRLGPFALSRDAFKEARGEWCRSYFYKKKWPDLRHFLAPPDIIFNVASSAFCTPEKCPWTVFFSHSVSYSLPFFSSWKFASEIARPSLRQRNNYSYLPSRILFVLLVSPFVPFSSSPAAPRRILGMSNGFSKRIDPRVSRIRATFQLGFGHHLPGATDPSIKVSRGSLPGRTCHLYSFLLLLPGVLVIGFLHRTFASPCIFSDFLELRISWYQQRVSVLFAFVGKERRNKGLN